MVAIKIYLADGSTRYLDLLPSTRLRVQQTMPAFDLKLETGILTLPVDIPWTDNNKAHLGYVENLNSLNANIPAYWRCDVESDGIPYMVDAKLVLLKHKGSFDARQGTYSFTISGIKGLFGSLIKGKTLRDLLLDGPINFDVDSRTFAYGVMSGSHPATKAKLQFAPIAIEDFIDTNRSDFNSEFLANDIVNNVLVDASYPLGWTFGRNKASTINLPVTAGDPTYENYRSVPFLNLFYVLRQIFIEHGFSVDGEFFNYPDFDLLHIYNTVGIELYDYPFTFDVNRQIVPSRHLPNMLISDFLINLQNTFNLRFDFLEGKRTIINFRYELLASTHVENWTAKCVRQYSDAERHEARDNGVKLAWSWDAEDSYRSDRVKDMKDYNIIATVELYADINLITLPSVIDNTTYIYVRAENYYYNFNLSMGMWQPALEEHEDWKYGKEQVAFTPEISPLCHYYLMDNFGVINRMNMLAARQAGCYYNDSRVLVEHEYGLRLFYIKPLSTASLTDMPTTFCHNYDANGDKLVDTSLSWKAPDGLYEKLWRTWINMLLNSWIIRAQFSLTNLDIYHLRNIDVLLLHNNQYLIQKIEHDLPILGDTDIELVKL